MSAQLFSLKGKTTLITGATSGIGQGMAIGLAEAGSNIIFTHRTNPETLVEILSTANPNIKAIGIYADLADISSIKSICAKAIGLSPTGQIDVLINNAGVQYRSPFNDFPEDEWNKVLDVNLHVPTLLTREIGRHFLDKGIQGRVIFTASLLSFSGGLNASAYACAKGALKQLTMSLSNEWAKHGITVNSIAPGYIDTKMNVNVMNDKARFTHLSSRIPAGRWGVPGDFKGPVVFLSSEASTYVTGITLLVDGGWSGW